MREVEMNPFRLTALLMLAVACASVSPAPAVRVIAHRGASAYAPENTLPAIARALARGADEVELDVQLTADGVAILFHDSLLLEKTDAPGRIADHTAAALQPLDIGHWFDRTHPATVERFSGTGLATLGEAFRAFGSLPVYHLELKSEDPALVPVVLADIQKFQLASRIWLTSFHSAQLERARTLAPELPRCQLIDRHRLQPAEGAPNHRAAIDTAAKAGAQMVGIAAAELTPELVRHAHARGLEIRAWKVRTLDDWRRIVAMGADGGTVDWPDLARRALSEPRDESSPAPASD